MKAATEGDIAAIRLLLERVDGPVVQVREVKHTSRLIVRPDADPRVVEVEATMVSRDGAPQAAPKRP